jgi:hypothetical protein
MTEPTTIAEYRAELERMNAYWRERGWIEPAARRYQRLQRELSELESVRTFHSDRLGRVTIVAEEEAVDHNHGDYLTAHATSPYDL